MTGAAFDAEDDKPDTHALECPALDGWRCRCEGDLQWEPGEDDAPLPVLRIDPMTGYDRRDASPEASAAYLAACIRILREA